MVSKKTEKSHIVVEAEVSQTFGKTDLSVYPKWPTPVTIRRTREYDSEADEWCQFIAIETESVVLKFDLSAWEKFEQFVKHSETFMEQV